VLLFILIYVCIIALSDKKKNVMLPGSVFVLMNQHLKVIDWRKVAGMCGTIPISPALPSTWSSQPC